MPGRGHALALKHMLLDWGSQHMPQLCLLLLLGYLDNLHSHTNVSVANGTELHSELRVTGLSQCSVQASVRTLVCVFWHVDLCHLTVRHCWRVTREELPNSKPLNSDIVSSLLVPDHGRQQRQGLRKRIALVSCSAIVALSAITPAHIGHGNA